MAFPRPGTRPTEPHHDEHRTAPGLGAHQDSLIFLPPSPIKLDPLVLFSLLLVGGLIVGETLFRTLGLSRIVGYVLAGAISGPGALGWLDRETIALAKPLADTALGLLLMERDATSTCAG